MVRCCTDVRKVGIICDNYVLCPHRKLYHPNNAQLGMAVMRAGLTNWHAGNIEVGHGMICKAYAILLVTHGPSHPITKDLEASSISGLTSFSGLSSLYRWELGSGLCFWKVHRLPTGPEGDSEML